MAEGEIKAVSELEVEGIVGRLVTDEAVTTADPEVLAEIGIDDLGVVEVRSRARMSMLARIAAKESDRGTRLIRLGLSQLKTLKAGLDDPVTISRVQVSRATRLVLEPLAPLIRPISEYEGEIRALLANRQQLLQAGMLLSVDLQDFRREVLFRVIATSPDRAVADHETRVVVRTSMLPTGVAANLVTFDDVGGLQAEIAQIRELVECPLLFPRVYVQLGIAPPRGILLHGPPGVGKTYLARAIANEVGAHFLYINGPEVLSSVQGGTEANLRSIFEEAMENTPSVVMIDEIDAIAPERRESGHADARMGTQLLSLLDGLVNMEDVVVLGTTNRLDAIDPALRRPGRFDREIMVGPPDATGRLSILRIHTRGVPLTKEATDELIAVADATHGYTGADLVDLVREAGLSALRRHVGPSLERLNDPERGIPDIQVDEDDLNFALEHTSPSALREALVTAPGASWDDVGGLGEVVSQLREAVEIPIQHAAAFREIGLSASRGVILHGVPGTGKSLLARAAARESGANLVTINGPEIFSKWLGESEGHIRDAFRIARQSSPTILLLEQLDALAPQRVAGSTNSAAERVVNQLLTELDSLNANAQVIVVATTNRLDLIDRSLLRPGRFGVQIEVPLPDANARARILEVNLRLAVGGGPEGEWNDAIETVVAATDGASGADLTAICDDARMLALRDHDYAGDAVLGPQHLRDAVKRFQSSWRPDRHASEGHGTRAQFVQPETEQ